MNAISTTAQAIETTISDIEKTESELERVKRIMMEAARRNYHEYGMGSFPAFDRAAHWAHAKFARGLSEEDFRQFQLYIREVETDLGQRTIEDFEELAQTVHQDRREAYCLWVLGATAGYEPDERQRVLDWLKIKLARLFGGNAVADEWIQRHTAPTTPKKPAPKKRLDDHTGHRAKEPQTDTARAAKRNAILPNKGTKPTDVAAQEAAPMMPVVDGYEPSETDIRARAADIQQSNANVFEAVDDALLATARGQLMREHATKVAGRVVSAPVTADSAAA